MRKTANLLTGANRFFFLVWSCVLIYFLSNGNGQYGENLASPFALFRNLQSLTVRQYAGTGNVGINDAVKSWMDEACKQSFLSCNPMAN